MISLKEKLMAGVEFELNTGCWLWAKAALDSGYGVMGIARRRNSTTHRASWTVHRGPIPNGLCVLHRCDTRLCINPDHLFLGTKADNTADMMRKGRLRKTSKTRIFETDKADIIARRGRGEPLKDVAAIYKCSIARISQVARGISR